jgi:hypothetical protein
MKFCPNCGQRLIIQETQTIQENPQELKSKTVVIERAEPVYYSDEKGVRITPTRLVMPGKNNDEGPTTYAMANITSIKVNKNSSNLWVGILIACVGVILIIIGLQGSDMEFLTAIGGIAVLLGILLAILLKSAYNIRISSASGEVDALPPSRDKQYVEKIATAINEALIKRG